MTRRRRRASELALEAATGLDKARRKIRQLEAMVAAIGLDLNVDVDGLDPAPDLRAPVLVIAAAANRKLAPVDMVANTTERLRPVPRRPFCSATYVPVRQTCPDSCPFRGHGCMAEAGYTGRAVRRLEALAEGFDAWDLARIEAAQIDRLLPDGVPRDGGRDGLRQRDLRLHVSGDTVSRAGLELIAAAVERWRLRGGGSAWSFTHAWRALPREAWGPVSILASVETPDEANHARDLGYTPAITARSFPSRSTFRVTGSSTTWIPCPAETSGRTCVECRLCLDREPWLNETNRGIAFAVHGLGAEAAKARLPVLSGT